MLPSVRFVRWSALLALLVAVAASVVLAGRSPSAPQSMSALFGGASTATRWGPVSPADRDMLIKIRQADLFDGPASQQAAERAVDPGVRTVAGQLADAHAQLDRQLMDVANQLGIPLPTQPSDQQKLWLTSISSAGPTGYDSSYVNLLRGAYGELLPLIDGARAGTQNSLVRQIAVTAGDLTGQGMRQLEGTNLVNYSLLPASTAPAARLTAIGDYAVPITLLLFLAAAGIGAVMLRALSPARSAERGADRGGWLARVLGALGGGRTGDATSKEADQPRRAGRRRRGSSDRLVTTAELLAVLGADEPRAHQSGADEPSAYRPSAHRPRADEPSPYRPGADKPGASRPGADEPGADEPGAHRSPVQRPGGARVAATSRLASVAPSVPRPRDGDPDRRPPKLGKTRGDRSRW